MEKLVIIGSGPAGWTAAIYAARANLSPLVFEGAITEENRLNGTLPLGPARAHDRGRELSRLSLRRYGAHTECRHCRRSPRLLMAPHRKHGVSGPELMELMRQQAVNFGTRIVTDDIAKVDLSRRPFKLSSARGPGESKRNA